MRDVRLRELGAPEHFKLSAALVLVEESRDPLILRLLHDHDAIIDDAAVIAEAGQVAVAGELA